MTAQVVEGHVTKCSRLGFRIEHAALHSARHLRGAALHLPLGCARRSQLGWQVCHFQLLGSIITLGSFASNNSAALLWASPQAYLSKVSFDESMDLI
ncbi:hypothetical protein O181_036485 [Austropuccinia psidii MF-1]|uniref:Uncharacterized protein n=1 Tax=Austropuccinia psidii MF-1 TaxID=1389203 RepID=A0A9Q3D6M3_9BASI|nr:hypothetical protein [Austropuccinia psidii MF-1]